MFNISHPSLDKINRLMNKATMKVSSFDTNQIPVLTIVKALSIFMEVTQSLGR